MLRNPVPQKGGGEEKDINLCGAISHDQRCGGEGGQASMTAKAAILVSQKGGGKGKALYCREQWPLGHSSLRGLASSYHHRRGGGVECSLKLYGVIVHDRMYYSVLPS